MQPVDPWTWLVARSGLYMVEAPPIDPRTLVLPELPPRRPKEWAPSIHDTQHGIVGERTAANLHRTA